MSHHVVQQWASAIGSLRLLIWPCLILLYYLLCLIAVLDGYTKELLGHKTHEHHKHLHKVVWQWHTGLHVDPRRSYGDERRLKKTAASSTRSTPEGAMVYWSRRRRPARALHNNLISVGIISLIYGLLFWSSVTIQIITVLVILGLLALGAWAVRKMRAHRAAQPSRRVPVKELAAVGAADSNSLHITGAGDVRAEKPKLDGGVPQKVMALLLSDPISCSADQTLSLLSLSPDRGRLNLPDHFAATTKQREPVEAIVQSNTSSKVAFTWSTHAVPRYVEWVPVVTRLPTEVRFRDWVPAIERLWPGEFGAGIDLQRKMYVVSHNGDTPNHLRSCGPGTGKSTAFFVKAAQICKRDPAADLYCWDTKQVSFEQLHGIPGVYIFDDPVDHMGDIYNGFYRIWQIMRDRYTALRTKQATLADFNDLWMLVDEGNDLAAQMKLFYDKHVKERGDPAQPKVWTEAIAPLINMGRQVKIRGEWMFQNMTDRVLGGVSLRDAWAYIGMAGFNKNQFSRIIGTTMPELRTGPGRLYMVNGPDERWIQGFWDDDDYLREYALSARKERAA